MKLISVRTGLVASAIPLLVVSAAGASSASSAAGTRGAGQAKSCQPYAATPVRFDAFGVHMVLGAGSVPNKRNSRAVLEGSVYNIYSIDGRSHVVYAHLRVEVRHTSTAAYSTYRLPVAAHTRSNHYVAGPVQLTVGKRLLGYKYDMRAVVIFGGQRHATAWRHISRCG